MTDQVPHGGHDNLTPRSESASTPALRQPSSVVQYGHLDAMQLLQYYRAETKLEFDLLHHRLLWLTTTQTILLSGAGLLLSRASSANPLFLQILLPVLGTAIAGFSWFSVSGALDTVDLWKERKNELLKSAGSEWRDLTACARDHAKQDPTHARSLWFPRLLPALFFVAWLAVALLAR